MSLDCGALQLAEYIGPFLMEPSNLAVVCSMLEPVFASSGAQLSGSVDIATHAAAVCAALSLLHELQPVSLAQSGDGAAPPAEQCTPQQQQLVAVTLPFALHLLQQCVNSDDMTHMSSVSEALSGLVKANSLLFRETWAALLETVREACTGGAGEEGISDDSVKCVLLEMLADLMTGRDSRSLCCNQQSRSACLTLCISMLCRVELSEGLEIEDEAYLNGPLPSSEDAFGDEDGDEVESSLLAASILSTFLRKWPIQETLPHCHQVIGQLFQGEGGCASIRAALFLTSMLFDLLGTEMQQYSPSLVPTLLALTEHSHPRLRLCALLCFKSLVLADYDDEEEEGFRMTFHEIFFPFILQSIQDNINFPKLACQGINTLRAFCDPQTCPQVLVLPHTQSILEMSWVLLSKRNEFPAFLLEECVPLIGNISIIDPDSFAPHYTNFMDTLSAMLMPCQSDGSASSNFNQQELRGKCLECCALLGTSVGYDTFLPHATQLLEFMISLQSNTAGESFDFSDPLASYMVQACARIAGVLGQSFEPYLHQVMPILLQHITQEIEHNVQTEEQFEGGAGGKGGSGDDYVTVYQRGTGNIRFFNNSHAMKEKELSLRTLYQYILDIPRLMFPFVPDILRAVSCVSPIHCCSEDNTDSLTIIGAIISDACKLWLRFAPASEQSAEAISNMFETASAYLLATLQEANKIASAHGNVAFSVAAVDNARLTLLIFVENNDVARSSPMSLSTGRALFLCLRDQIHMWITRKYEGRADLLGGEGGREGEGEGEGEEGGMGDTRAQEEEEQAEEDLWLGLTDSVGHLFHAMALADASLLFQQDVLPFFVPLLPASEGSLPLLSLLISILTDAVEAFAKNEALCHSVIELLAPFLFRYVDQDDVAILCVYGMGACALHGGDSSVWASHAADASACLLQCLQLMVSSEQDEDTDEELKGTIVSALFKVGISQDNSEALLVQVLQSLLPLACFPYEARECHSLLVDEMMRGNARLLGGASGSNLVVLLGILAQLAALDLAVCSAPLPLPLLSPLFLSLTQQLEGGVWIGMTPTSGVSSWWRRAFSRRCRCYSRGEGGRRAGKVSC